MVLKDLVEQLKRVLDLGKSNPEAWRALLDITTNDVNSQADILFAVSTEQSSQHLNKVLSGERPLSADYAGKICDSGFDPSLLADRINDLSLTVRSRLAKQLVGYESTLTGDSVGQWCASQLADFVLPVLEESDPRRIEVEERIKKHTQRELIRKLAPWFVQQVNGICPQKGCNTPLIKLNDSGESYDNYEIVTIDPEGEVTQNNLIALCPSCAKAYLSAKSSEQAYLAARKQALSTQQKNNEILHPEKVEEAIRSVLQKLKGLKQLPPTFGLKTDPPLQVKQKIPNDFLLATRIEGHVANWFKFIHSELQSFDYGGCMSFDLLKVNINYHYIKLEAQKLSQEEIVNELARYLSVTTGESPQACEIVVAYFIQNCEVFRATT